MKYVIQFDTGELLENSKSKSTNTDYLFTSKKSVELALEKHALEYDDRDSFEDFINDHNIVIHEVSNSYTLSVKNTEELKASWTEIK